MEIPKDIRNKLKRARYWVVLACLLAVIVASFYQGMQFVIIVLLFSLVAWLYSDKITLSNIKPWLGLFTKIKAGPFEAQMPGPVEGESKVPQLTRPAEQFQRTTPKKLEGRSPMERKILRTLWTKQVNRYDQWRQGVVWTFRINTSYPPSKEFLDWRKTATELIVEGIALEANNGQIHLTHEGFEYCKKYYEEFGEEEFWPGEAINEEMLKRVLADR